MWGRSKTVWSPVEVEYLKTHMDEPVAQLTIALAKSVNAIRNKIAELEGKPVKVKARKTISRIGKRKDLGLFLRSGWESNLARVFKYEGLEFFYEPKVFYFDKFKHGTVSYVPDFRLGNRWVEVKGFLKNQDKTKIRRFKRFYPDEAKNLVAVCNPKTKAEEFFKEEGIPILHYYKDLDKKYRDLISEWE